jgi:molybdate transport system permease protein
MPSHPPEIDHHTAHIRSRRTPPDWPFWLGMGLALGMAALLVLGLLAAQASYTTPARLWQALADRELQHALWTSLWSSAVATGIAMGLGVPASYLLSRVSFPGRNALDVLVNLPLALPPVIIGASLLILFNTPLLRPLDDVFPLKYAPPGLVLAQLPVALALVISVMRAAFDGISPRHEAVALTLGSTRAQAFRLVILPEARGALVAAATLAWTRALGEFGPILIFIGVMPNRTEVLTTAVYRRMGSLGNIEAAMAVSLLMVLLSAAVLLIVRRPGRATR